MQPNQGEYLYDSRSDLFSNERRGQTSQEHRREPAHLHTVRLPPHRLTVVLLTHGSKSYSEFPRATKVESLCDYEGNVLLSLEEDVRLTARVVKDILPGTRLDSLNEWFKFNMSVYSYLFLPIACEVRSRPWEESLPGNFSQGTVSGIQVDEMFTRIQSVDGYLPIPLYTELVVFGIIVVVEGVTIVAYIIGCLIQRQYVNLLQKRFLVAVLLTFATSTAVFIYLEEANENNLDNGGSWPPTMALKAMFGLKETMNMVFVSFVSTVGRGWGILYDRLRMEDYIAGSFLVIVAIISVVVSNVTSVYLLWLHNSLAVLVLIISCSIGSSRVRNMNPAGSNFEPKSRMFRRLFILVAVLMTIGMLFAGAMFIPQLVYYINYPPVSGFAYDWSPSLAWDLIMPFLVLGCAIIWWPSRSAVALNFGKEAEFLVSAPPSAQLRGGVSGGVVLAPPPSSAPPAANTGSGPRDEAPVAVLTINAGTGPRDEAPVAVPSTSAVKDEEIALV